MNFNLPHPLGLSDLEPLLQPFQELQSIVCRATFFLAHNAETFWHLLLGVARVQPTSFRSQLCILDDFLHIPRLRQHKTTPGFTVQPTQ